MRRRRQPEIVAGRVATDGSIAAGDGFTTTKIGTGAYTVTFPSGFRLISMTVTATTGSYHLASLSGPSGGTFNVATFNSSTGAAGDASFGFIAAGVQQ